MSDTLVQTSYEMVNVENTSRDVTYDLKYEGKHHRISPGQKVLVPWPVMNHWFGDPFITDHPTDKSKNLRAKERARIWHKWGVFHGEAAEVAAAKMPKLVVTDWEGNVLHTIVHDPFGEHLDTDRIAEQEQAAMKDQFRAMQRQMAQLQELLRQSGEDDPEYTGVPVQPSTPSPTGIPMSAPLTGDKVAAEVVAPDVESVSAPVVKMKKPPAGGSR